MNSLRKIQKPTHQLSVAATVSLTPFSVALFTNGLSLKSSNDYFITQFSRADESTNNTGFDFHHHKPTQQNRGHCFCQKAMLKHQNVLQSPTSVAGLSRKYEL